MNNFLSKKHYLGIFFLSLLLLSCNDEPLEGEFGEAEEENVFDPNENATFEVELNGDLFVAQSIDAFFTEDGYTIDARNGSREVSVFLPTLSVNAYPFSSSGEAGFISFTDNLIFPDAFFSGINGELVVTSLNQQERRASGEFEGALSEILSTADDIAMTNGLFQDIVFVPGFDDFDFDQIGGDFMTAVVDGEVFNADQVIVFTDLDLAQEEEEEETDGEDGDQEDNDEQEDLPEPEPQFVYVRGSETIEIDLPDTELPDGDGDNDIDLPDSFTQGITLIFPANQAIGVFEFDENSAIQVTLDVNENAEFATEGVIDVQVFNENEIRGQFNFITPSGEVTNGAFRATP